MNVRANSIAPPNLFEVASEEPPPLGNVFDPPPAITQQSLTSSKHYVNTILIGYLDKISLKPRQDL